MELFFDTETSGFYNNKLSIDDHNQAWVVQFGMILSDRDFIYHEVNIIICADGRTIDPEAEAVHCISAEISDNVGLPEATALRLFDELMGKATILICHNYDFDRKMISALYARHNLEYFPAQDTYCTMKSSTDLCKIPGKYGNYKWPKLQELHKFLFGEEFEDAHDALADVRATRRCYYEMVKEV